MRAYTHRFISFAIQCAVIILLALGLSFSAGHSLAQDVATDTPVPSDTATVAPTDVPTELPTVVPTDVPTELPTVVPTDVPTDVPTETVTDVPTEATTEQPTAAPTDPNVTAAPTEAVTQPPATPDTSNIFTEDFQDGETTGWLLTAGWIVADDAGNSVLTASTPNEIATLTAVSWSYFTLSFRVRGSIQLNMASGGSNYQIQVAADGGASLYKDGALLAQATGAVPTDATIEPSANWHTVNLLAPGNLLAIKVDNFTPISTSDATLVGMGPIMFSTAADSTSSVAFDDLSIQRLDAPPPVPTALPTASGVVPIPPPMNVTAEPTVDVTAEATVEATAEATVEATTEATAEATVEATTEATAEATVEATAEATVEPLGLNEAGRNKLPPALVDILDTYLTGDTAGAQAAAADYFITIDNQQRINLTVWTTDEQAAAKTAGEITASGGIITDAFSIRLQASVTLEGLLVLANAPEVTLLEVQPKAVSTSDMQAIAPPGFGTGSEISEGVDTSGATAWQSAGIKGAGVGIAVIDTGFGFGVTASGEYACLGSNSVLNQAADPADTVHGLYMVQVLCDMAPAAKVYMYKAVDASSLKSAITLATSSTAIKVIVIAMDLGASVTPGDGTDGGATYGLNGLYTAITAARTAGKIVIASAGNNTGRYVTLDYTNITTTVPMTVFTGDIIHVSWNDWSSSAQNLTLSYAGTNGAVIPSVNFSVNGGASPRPGAPRTTATIPGAPASCDAGCTINLSISGGTAALVVQVQVAGQGTINSAGVSGATVVSTAGNLARPADSSDVIAVGAVCNNSDVLQFPANINGLPVGTIRLKRDTFSSQGPVFGTLGALPSTSASYTRDQVKPDLMGISHVSVSGNTVNLQDPTTCSDQTSGFNGTSAAAANVAGMTALLLSTNKTNTSMAKFNVNDTTSVVVDEVQNYLQTHSMDDTTAASTMVGYDMLYGAGLTVLGSPTYNLDLVTTPATAANLLPASCAATAPLYVGLANAGSTQDGTLANPLISISEAMSKATASQCVVVLPGEYVAPVAASTSINAAGVLSYESATSFDATPSSLWSVFIPPISIGFNDIIIDGFTAQTAATLIYPSDTSVLRNPPLYLNTANNAVVQNNSFTGYTAPGSMSDSTGTQIKGNTFSAFVIPTITTQTIIAPFTHTAVLTITNSTLIGLSNNNFTSNYIGTTNSTTISPWQPALVGIRYSGVDVFNNRFTSNVASTLLGIDSWQGNPGTGSRQTAEVRVFGNLFNSNTVNGPFVHLFASQGLRFVNNTVVNNLMNGASNYDGYFMYGIFNSVFGNMGGSAVEIHNNLFYNNGAVNKGLLDTVNQNAFENVGCGSIAVPGGGVPVRNNWFNPPIGPSFISGACTDSDPTDNTGKIQNTITESFSAANFFGVATDSVDPFRLLPTDPSITTLKSGINTGDNQALIDMFGDPGYKSQFDLRGAGRVVIGGNPNPIYNSALAVDIGAYELGTPSAPIADPVTRTIAEDSATSVVFTLSATGGYTQVFTITSLPSEYDTNPTNACGGQPFIFTPPKTVTYCPPANFHTQYGASNTNVPITISYSVEDPIFKPGQISSSTISLTVTPVDDVGTPVVPTINVLSDYFTPIAQQLSPAYQLSNFVLTGTVPSVDYPFVYAYGTQTGTDNANLLSTGGNTTVQILQAALTAASTNGGKLLLNPVAGQQGYFSFTYTVTDRDGNQGTGNATVVILPTLAKEGLYDDASFNFAYNGTGWAPSFITGAYNNTLHASSVSNDSIEFPFTGSSVRFNLRGSAAGNTSTNTLKLAFKTNIGNGGITYQDYATTKASIPSLVCTDSINAGVPNGTSDVLNYSATGAAYTIICSGFPTGQVHSIRVTNNLNGATMTLDSAEVSAGVMSAGKSYQESSPNITYGNGWSQITNASMLGGAWAYTNVANASFSFNIDNSVGRVVLYRTTYVAGVYGTMNVYLDGNLSTPIAVINNTSAALLYGQPYLLTIASPGNHTITVKNIGATYSSIDQITTLSSAQSLGIGTYQESYPDLTYNGVWTSTINASALGNGWSYTSDPNASVIFKVDSTVSRVVIYRTTYIAGVYGSMNVYLDTNLTTPIATINNTSAALLYGQPFLFTIPTPGNHTITIKNVGATYSGIDQITLMGPTQTLTATPGIYQESDPNLTYNGVWATQVNSSTLGGAWSYTNDPTASVSFKIDSSVSRIIVYSTTYVAGVYGGMNVYLDSNLTTPIATINNTSATLLYAQPTLISIDVPGNHTITFKNMGSTYSDIDQITLLGPTQRLGTGIYQETDLNLTYTGLWSPQTLAGALGGSRKYTNQADASVSFKIDGTVGRVVIYRSTYLAGVYGSLNVYLDADLTTPIATINNTSASFLLGQPFPLTIATPGNHTITLKNVGSTYSDIDQITLLPTSTRLTAAASGSTYQDNFPDLTYSGTWALQALSSALEGSRTYTSQNNATVTFTVDNSVSRVIIYRTTYIAGVYGTMNIYLDDPTFTNPPLAVMDNTSAALLFGQPFLFNIPTPGNHTITIRNMGATYGDIDQITLLGAVQPLTTTPGTYQDTNVNLTYNGLWAPQSLASALGGSRTYTNQNNASVSFQIDVSVERVVLYRTTYIAGVYGSMNIYLDDPTFAGAPLAVMNNTSAGLAFGQPFLFNIPTPGNHTITIRNMGATYSDIDQITLLGAVQPLTTTPGTYQDTDLNLTYSGLWVPQPVASALGGSRTYTNQNNATVSFKVDNSVGRVVIYRTTYIASVYGSMNIYLDDPTFTNPPLVVMNNTSAGLAFGQPFVFTIPTPGNHTITIRNMGATYSDIDQITLLAPAQRLVASVTPYEESNPNLTYKGIWSSQALSVALGGSRIYTNQDGASVQFDIDGTVSRMIIYRTAYLAGVYGTMNVYLDTDLINPIAVINNTSTAVLYGQPFFLNIASPGNHTITLKNVGATYADLDRIRLLGPATPLSTAAFYEESDQAFNFTGAWTSIQGAGPSGNGAFYTYAQNASITFQITGNAGGTTAFSIARTLVPGAGTYTVSIDGAPQTFSDNFASVLWQQPLEFGPLTPGVHNVVITKTSSALDFIYFDAIRIIDTTAPLTVGQYQETYPGLAYTGTWTPSGSTKFTTVTNSKLTFKFTGNGFGFITTNPTATGTMTVSCTISGGPNLCTNPTSTPINGGYAFYNLKNATYDVEITYTGTGGLYIDRVFVLDTPTTILQPGTYEDTNPGLVYSPNDLWTTLSSASYSGGTAHFAAQKGAVMQVRFNGNSLTLYQLAYSAGSTNLNLCVYLTDAAGNPTSVCSTFSQNTPPALFAAPVAFYGFGTGTHEIVIENRSQGLQFSVDKILVN